MRNTDQDVLKYQKLYHWAHTVITSGVMNPMDKFPSETSLQKKFGYSRQTVRTALQKLEEEGLIVEAEHMSLTRDIHQMRKDPGSDCCSVTIPIICFRECMMVSSLH